MIAFLLVFFSLVQLVFAQFNLPQFPTQVWFNADALAKFLGVPADWLQIPKVIYFVIVPYLVAVTVTYGLLTELNLFRNSIASRKINILLSLLLSFLLLPSGALGYIVYYFYAPGTAFGLIAFGVVFIVGIAFWALGSGTRMRGAYQTPRQLGRDLRQMSHSIEIHRKRAEALNRDIVSHPGDPHVSQWIAERDQELAEMHEMTVRMAELHNKLKELTTT